MRPERFVDVKTGEEYVRVTKPTAKRLFMQGERVAIYPCLANPMSTWFYPPQVLCRKGQEEFVTDEIGMANRFEELCKSFEYYNCSKETGTRVIFFSIKN